MLKKVQSEYNELIFNWEKERATELHKEGKFAEALEFYDKCLRITRKATTLNNISVFVNKTACLYQLS